MSPETTILVALLLPVLAAVSCLLLGGGLGRPNLRDIATPLIGACTFAAVWRLAGDVLAGGRPELVLFEVLPGVELAFQVEPLGLLYGLVASGLWIVTSIYAVGYMRGHHEQNQTRFFTFFALSIFAALGIAFASNLFTLFLFYEALTLLTFPLVTHHGTDEARRAGRIYLGILLFTSISFLLFAILFTWRLTGTIEFTPGGILGAETSSGMVTVLLLLYAFGAGKAALMPFHRWLPNAMVAPTPVSALLHAVAVVKAGVFAILKIVVYVFGLDLLAGSNASLSLMTIASFTMLMAAVIAIRQDNLKARLAYSTISQLAYIVLGAAMATATGVLAGGMQIAMHAAGKITLFFCAGAILVATHKKKVSELDGLGRTMPWTFAAFFLASLSIIGIPPLGGSWAKWYLMVGALETGFAWQAAFLGVLMLSSLLAVFYLMPVVVRGFFAASPSAGPSGSAGGDRKPIAEAPFLCVAPLVLTALLSLALFFVAGDLVTLLNF